MKKNFYSRLLALLLAFTMVIGMAPAAFAEDEDNIDEEIIEILPEDDGEVTEIPDAEPENDSPAAEESDNSGASDNSETPDEPDSTVLDTGSEIPSDDTPDADTDEDAEEPAEDSEEASDEEADEEEAEDEDEEEEETSELPFGIAALSEDLFTLSAEEVRAKEALAANDVPAVVAGLSEGVDYVAGEAIFRADNEAYALMIAEAYNADLVSFEYGVAVISLREAPIAEAVALGADLGINLPIVEPNYICHLDPIYGGFGVEDVEELVEAESEVPVKESWASIKDGLSNPDPLLKNPSVASYQWQHDMVDTYEAWGVTEGSSGVKVAVIDSGYYAHSDLNGKISGTYVSNSSAGITSASDQNGHGTHVAGIIAGTINNGTAGAGIAPNVSIYSVRVTAANGQYETADLIKGINLAASSGAQIINMSLGSPYYSNLEYSAVSSAIARGCTVVVSMGNDGTNLKRYPAAYGIKGLIAVGAVDRTGSRAFFSNSGSWQDVAAPGVDILSCGISGTSSTAYMSGTSQAAPIVSGVCALYMSVYGNPGPSAMESIIKKSTVNGVVNAAKLFSGDKTAPSIRTSSNIISGATVPYNGTVTMSASNVGEVIIYTTNGKNPSVRSGSIVSGAKYTGAISVSSLGKVGSTVTIKAASVSGMGVLSNIRTFKIKIGKPDPTSLTISKPDYLASGKSCTLTVAVLPEGASPTVSWQITSSSNVTASIDAAGKLKATLNPGYSSGSVTVTATSAVNGKTAGTTVTVKNTNPVSKMSIATGSGTTIYSGSTVSTRPLTTKLTVSCKDADGNPVSPSLSYSTSNKKVAVVSSSGTVTAVGKGTATITVKANDGSGKSATIKITVKQLLNSVSISGQAAIAPGKSATYKAKVTPANANNSGVIWSVSDSSIASVSSTGVVKVSASAAAGSSFRLTATAKDGSGVYASTTIYVRNLVSAISLSPKAPYTTGSTCTIYAKDYPNTSADDTVMTVSAYYTDSYGYSITPAAVTWTSSDKSVATVTGTATSATIKGLKPGTVTITVKPSDGSGKSKSFKVKVIIPASSIAIRTKAGTMDGGFYNDGTMYGNYQLAAGKSVTHSAKLGDAYGTPTNKNVNWRYAVYYKTAGMSSPQPTTAYNSYISLSSTGKLTVKNALRNYVYYTSSSNYRYIWIDVYAETKDGTGLTSDYIEYLVTDPIAKLQLSYNGWKVTSLTMGKNYEANVDIDLFYYIFLDPSPKQEMHSWTVKSSNPSIVGAIMNDDESIHILAGSAAGTATITVSANDGSGKKATLRVTVR